MYAASRGHLLKTFGGATEMIDDDVLRQRFAIIRVSQPQSWSQLLVWPCCGAICQCVSQARGVCGRSLDYNLINARSNKQENGHSARFDLLSRGPLIIIAHEMVQLA